jgi:molybdopterin-guanine dinucleotide biosynthesis protein A
MGGRAKGLLLTPGGVPLVERWARLFRELDIPMVLVGGDDAYAGTGLEQIDDAVAHIGPLGGLIALLERARSGSVVAVACDMPFVSPALLEKLVDHAAGAAAVAPRDAGLWQPLFARYDVPRALVAARENARRARHSLQDLLDTLGASVLPLDSREQHELRDWDTPQDVERDRRAPKGR